MQQIPIDTGIQIQTARQQYEEALKIARTPLAVNQTQTLFTQTSPSSFLTGIQGRQQYKQAQKKYEIGVAGAQDIFETSVVRAAPEYGKTEYVEKEYAAIRNTLQQKLDNINLKITELRAKGTSEANTQANEYERMARAYKEGLAMDKYSAIQAGQGDYFDKLANAYANEYLQAKTRTQMQQQTTNFSNIYNPLIQSRLSQKVDELKLSNNYNATTLNQAIKEVQDWAKNEAKKQGVTIQFPEARGITTAYISPSGAKITKEIIPQTIVQGGAQFYNIYDKKTGEIIGTQTVAGPETQIWPTGAITYADVGKSETFIKPTYKAPEFPLSPGSAKIEIGTPGMSQELFKQLFPFTPQQTLEKIYGKSSTTTGTSGTTATITVIPPSSISGLTSKALIPLESIWWPLIMGKKTSAETTPITQAITSPTISKNYYDTDTGTYYQNGVPSSRRPEEVPAGTLFIGSQGISIAGGKAIGGATGKSTTITEFFTKTGELPTTTPGTIIIPSTPGLEFPRPPALQLNLPAGIGEPEKPKYKLISETFEKGLNLIPSLAYSATYPVIAPTFQRVGENLGLFEKMPAGSSFLPAPQYTFIDNKIFILDKVESTSVPGQPSTIIYKPTGIKIPKVVIEPYKKILGGSIAAVNAIDWATFDVLQNTPEPKNKEWTEKVRRALNLDRADISTVNIIKQDANKVQTTTPIIVPNVIKTGLLIPEVVQQKWTSVTPPQVQLPEGIRVKTEKGEMMYPFGGGEPYFLPKNIILIEEPIKGAYKWRANEYLKSAGRGLISLTTNPWIAEKYGSPEYIAWQKQQKEELDKFFRGEITQEELAKRTGYGGTGQQFWVKAVGEPSRISDIARAYTTTGYTVGAFNPIAGASIIFAGNISKMPELEPVGSQKPFWKSVGIAASESALLGLLGSVGKLAIGRYASTVGPILLQKVPSETGKIIIGGGILGAKAIGKAGENIIDTYFLSSAAEQFWTTGREIKAGFVGPETERLKRLQEAETSITSNIAGIAGFYGGKLGGEKGYVGLMKKIGGVKAKTFEYNKEGNVVILREPKWTQLKKIFTEKELNILRSGNIDLRMQMSPRLDAYLKNEGVSIPTKNILFRVAETPSGKTVPTFISEPTWLDMFKNNLKDIKAEGKSFTASLKEAFLRTPVLPTMIIDTKILNPSYNKLPLEDLRRLEQWTLSRSDPLPKDLQEKLYDTLVTDKLREWGTRDTPEVEIGLKNIFRINDNAQINVAWDPIRREWRTIIEDKSLIPKILENIQSFRKMKDNIAKNEATFIKTKLDVYEKDPNAKMIPQHDMKHAIETQNHFNEIFETNPNAQKALEKMLNKYDEKTQLKIIDYLKNEFAVRHDLGKRQSSSDEILGLEHANVVADVYKYGYGKTILKDKKFYELPNSIQNLMIDAWKLHTDFEPGTLRSLFNRNPLAKALANADRYGFSRFGELVKEEHLFPGFKLGEERTQNIIAQSIKQALKIRTERLWKEFGPEIKKTIGEKELKSDIINHVKQDIQSQLYEGKEYIKLPTKILRDIELQVMFALSKPGRFIETEMGFKPVFQIPYVGGISKYFIKEQSLLPSVSAEETTYIPTKETYAPSVTIYKPKESNYGIYSPITLEYSYKYIPKEPNYTYPYTLEEPRYKMPPRREPPYIPPYIPPEKPRDNVGYYSKKSLYEPPYTPPGGPTRIPKIPIIPPPIPPISKYAPKKIEKKKLTRGYEVLIRRRKKFQEAAPFAFKTKEMAITYGAKKVLSEAAATFQVKPSVKPITEAEVSGVNLKQYFRRPTGKGQLKGEDMFIQLARKRIITPGEVRAISYAGIAARTGKTPKRPASFTPKTSRKTMFLKSTKLKNIVF